MDSKRPAPWRGIFFGGSHPHPCPLWLFEKLTWNRGRQRMCCRQKSQSHWKMCASTANGILKKGWVRVHENSRRTSAPTLLSSNHNSCWTDLSQQHRQISQTSSSPCASAAIVGQLRLDLLMLQPSPLKRCLSIKRPESDKHQSFVLHGVCTKTCCITFPLVWKEGTTCHHQHDFNLLWCKTCMCQKQAPAQFVKFVTLFLGRMSKASLLEEMVQHRARTHARTQVLISPLNLS